MSKGQTLSTDYVHSLLNYASQQGYDVLELLQNLGIKPQQLQQAQFPVKVFSHLFQHLTELLQDEQFGMLTGGKVPRGAFRMMCYAIAHSADLQVALQRCSDFYDICAGPTIKPAIAVQGEWVWFHFVARRNAPADVAQRQLQNPAPVLIRTSLSIWHHFISWMIGCRLPLQQASFSCAAPANAADYRLLFPCPLRFNQRDNGFWFERHWLERPLVQSESAWRGFLKTAPYQLMVMVNGDDSMSARVKAHFGRDFSRPLPSLSEIAEQEGISSRTLRRQLAAEGVNYSYLKSQCRLEAAVDFLNCPKLSIHDVAALVGFEDPSPFIRAFKQWTGKTPGEYRVEVMQD
ncbi:MAG: AraC family transcriptional regulator [Ferrimonas sp.]